MLNEGHTVVLEYVAKHALDVLVSLPLAFLGYLIARGARNAIIHKLPIGNGDSTIKVFLANCAYSVMIALVIISVLGILGIPTATLITIVGASGLAVGLALQGTLSNVAAGILLVILRPFKVGDSIETNGVKGVVSQINIFTTELLTTNNDMIFVPNSKIISDNIINHTAHQTRRIDFLLSIGPMNDSLAVKELLLATLLAERAILSVPPPSVSIHGRLAVGDEISIQVWVNKEDYTAVQSSLMDIMTMALDRAGIQRPMPALPANSAI